MIRLKSQTYFWRIILILLKKYSRKLQSPRFPTVFLSETITKHNKKTGVLRHFFLFIGTSASGMFLNEIIVCM